MFVLAYDAETEVVIERRSIHSLPNTIFCLSPEIKHHEVQSYLPPKYCAIFIEKEFFEKSLSYYSKEPLYFNGLVVKIKRKKMNLLIRDFMSEAQHKTSSQAMVLESIATLLTHELIRNIVAFESCEIPLSENMLINEVVKFMNISYEKEITVDDLAKRLNLSKSHFTKLFTDSMQVSPMVYLRTIRLQNAKKMLQSKELSVTEVARQCGFNSTSYFTKLFREKYKQTPKKLLKR